MCVCATFYASRVIMILYNRITEIWEANDENLPYYRSVIRVMT
jgi:hypothetical protein